MGTSGTLTSLFSVNVVSTKIIEAIDIDLQYARKNRVILNII